MPLGDSRQARRSLIGVAIVSQVLRPIGLAFACAAVGADIPLAALVMWLPLGALVNLLPVSVAGFGGQQAAYVAYFSLFGVPTSVGLAVSILYSLMQLAADMVGGVVFALSRSSRPEVPAPAETANAQAPH